MIQFSIVRRKMKKYFWKKQLIFDVQRFVSESHNIRKKTKLVTLEIIKMLNDFLLLNTLIMLFISIGLSAHSRTIRVKWQFSWAPTSTLIECNNSLVVFLLNICIFDRHIITRGDVRLNVETVQSIPLILKMPNIWQKSWKPLLLQRKEYFLWNVSQLHSQVKDKKWKKSTAQEWKNEIKPPMFIGKQFAKCVHEWFLPGQNSLNRQGSYFSFSWQILNFFMRPSKLKKVVCKKRTVLSIGGTKKTSTI